MSLTLGAALGLGAGSAAVNLGGSFLGSLFNKGAAEAALEKQVAASKELLDYQMEQYYSPKAQMKHIGQAGLNPVGMFGNTAPVNVGGSMVMPTAPTYGLDVGTQSLSDVASLLVGAAQAKKAGVEIPNIEAETQSKVLGNERQEFENMLLQKYGIQKSAAELALAEQNVKLASASTDVSVQEKALKQWQSAKEKALSEVNERQRDILQKELDNKDIELDIRNRQGEANIVQTKASANAANASAEASRAQAANFSADTETKNIFNKFYKDRRYQHSFMSQVVEQGKEAVSRRLVTDRQAEQLEYMVEQAAYSNDMKEFTYWSNQVSGFVNTLGQAASQFYGAGALRELINLRQVQQQPTLRSSDGYYMQNGLLFKDK